MDELNTYKTKDTKMIATLISLFVSLALGSASAIGTAVFLGRHYELGTIWLWVIGIVLAFIYFLIFFCAAFYWIENRSDDKLRKAFLAKDYKKVIELLKSDGEDIAKPDSLTSEARAYILGLMYCLGAGGLKRDFNVAMRFFGRASREGHVDAKCMIGCMYLMGMGCEANKQKAIEYLDNAIMDGSSKAIKVKEKFGLN